MSFVLRRYFTETDRNRTKYECDLIRHKSQSSRSWVQLCWCWLEDGHHYIIRELCVCVCVCVSVCRRTPPKLLDGMTWNFVGWCIGLWNRFSDRSQLPVHPAQLPGKHTRINPSLRPIEWKGNGTLQAASLRPIERKGIRIILQDRQGSLCTCARA